MKMLRTRMVSHIDIKKHVYCAKRHNIHAFCFVFRAENRGQALPSSFFSAFLNCVPNMIIVNSTASVSATGSAV